jgi:ubiquinone/menaquinone biosynthesis C-methylase UbiE
MTTPASQYEYRGPKAAYWDLLRGDTSRWEDRPFYWAAIKASGEPALDVGCGTGRLLLDFLAQGIHIDGVDNSPEMLELCRQKAQPLGLRPALFKQPMEELQLPRAYRTIIVPSSSFQLVTDRAAAAEAMHRFFQHLEPGGSLVMPFMLLWQGQTDSDTVTTDWEIRAEATRPDDGAVVRRWSRSTFDVVGQLEHTEDRYEVIRGGEVVEAEHQVRSPATRWYTQPQVVELYTAAGFADVRLVRGFTDVPATEADTIFSAFGRRP